ncbi:MAG: 50S ribosomal protein L10 [Phycisphaerales bacterium]|nr:50S ribosomal protein L10 [Phycisphaerales bacterium]
MSKPVKDMITAEYANRFGDLDGALVVDIRGMPANANNEMRLDLFAKDIRVTIVKNTLARKAFSGTALENLGTALDGPSAVVYGANSVVDVAREIIAWAKKVKNLELKGAVLDGEYFGGADGVKRLSTFPTRDEAIAKVVSIALAPGGKVVGAALAPGAALLGIVKEIQERLEKGETIGKV